MTRFYANENLPMSLVQALRGFNYDVLTSYEAGQANQGIPDSQVLNYATAENRSIITLNRNDFISLHRSGINHSGIVICKDDRDYFGQAKVLQDYWKNELQDLKNILIRVQKENQPNSGKQIFIIRQYHR
jgi:hypothetical protein